MDRTRLESWLNEVDDLLGLESEDADTDSMTEQSIPTSADQLSDSPDTCTSVDSNWVEDETIDGLWAGEEAGPTPDGYLHRPVWP